MREIEDFVKMGFEQPLRIQEDFQKFQFLFERSPKNIFKSLFGEQKEAVVVDNISILKVDEEIGQYVCARNSIS